MPNDARAARGLTIAASPKTGPPVVTVIKPDVETAKKAH
jgi:hypothetical protein